METKTLSGSLIQEVFRILNCLEYEHFCKFFESLNNSKSYVNELYERFAENHLNFFLGLDNVTADKFFNFLFEEYQAQSERFKKKYEQKI